MKIYLVLPLSVITLLSSLTAHRYHSLQATPFLPPGVRLITPKVVWVINIHNIAPEYQTYIKTSLLKCEYFYDDLFIIIIFFISLAVFKCCGKLDHPVVSEKEEEKRKKGAF